MTTTPAVCLDNGTWIDLTDVEFPANITDTENIPSGVTDLEWLKDELYEANYNNDGEIYLAFLDQVCSSEDYYDVRDNHVGTYTDITDFARALVDGQIPSHLEYYFDLEAYADELKDGHHFVDLPSGDVAVFVA